VIADLIKTEIDSDRSQTLVSSQGEKLARCRRRAADGMA
jgi:hypothetical protein